MSKLKTKLALLLASALICATSLYLGYSYGYSVGSKEGLLHADENAIKDLNDGRRIEIARLSVPVLNAIVTRPDAFDQQTIVLWRTISKSVANSIEVLILPSLKKSDPDMHAKLQKTIGDIRSLAGRIPAVN
jgi:hypothetical protein